MHSETTTVDNLVGLLLQEEARIDQDLAKQAATQLPSSTIPAPPPTVPAAHQVSRTHPLNRSPSSFSGNSFNPSDHRQRCPHCQLYNKPGHEAINCWQRGNQTDYPSKRPL